jgi:hypothetical protein
MSGENQGEEYIKIIQDIIETELNLKPGDPASKNPNDFRVFIYNQNFNFPTYNDMLIVLSEVSTIKIGGKSSISTDTTPKEIQELIVKKEIGIDIMSVNSEARERKEEVLLALDSFYSQQKQEANGFRIFSFSDQFIDASAAEGAGQTNRYHAAIIIHARYSKEKVAGYFDNFNTEETFNA